MLESLRAARRGPVSSLGLPTAPGTPISLLAVVILTRHRLLATERERGETCESEIPSPARLGAGQNCACRIWWAQKGPRPPPGTKVLG